MSVTVKWKPRLGNAVTTHCFSLPQTELVISLRREGNAVYSLADRRRRGYTAAEVHSASLLVALEAMNHGSAELGLGNLYDQKRVEINADRLFESWVEMKTPKCVQ